MAIIKNNTNKKSCKDRKKVTLMHCYWECKLVQLLWKIVWRQLKKLKKEAQYDPTIPFLGICKEKKIPQNQKNTNFKTCKHPSVQSSNIYSHQDLEAT